MEYTRNVVLHFMAIWLCFLTFSAHGGNVCPIDCIRGLCLALLEPVCECGVFYEGPACASVNLDLPTKAFGSDFVAFTWNTDSSSQSVPNLNQFVFLVYLLNSQDIRKEYFLREPVGGVDAASNVRLNSLMSGGYRYVSCLIHNSTQFDNLTDTEFIHLTHEDRTSCFSFRTGYDENDPYTQAAMWVAGTMGVVLGLIFFAGTVRQCRKTDSVGKRIQRSLRSSWKAMFTQMYEESKIRVDQETANDSYHGVASTSFRVGRPTHSSVDVSRSGLGPTRPGHVGTPHK